MEKIKYWQRFGGLKYNHYLCPKLIYIAHER